MASGNLLFYYFGDDEAYFKTLQGEFRKHTRLTIEFKRIFENTEKKVQSLFLKVYRDAPAAVFIDFSKQTQDYMHLARIIMRTRMTHTFVTIGLVDYLSPPEVIAESIATGVNLTHIKSAESYDVVFDIVKLIAPAEISAHGYATAKLNESWEAGLTSKVGFIDMNGLHIETDFKASKGDRLRINHHWASGKLVPSKEVFVRDVSSVNLFYHFKHSCDVDFLFIDEFIPPEGMEELTIMEKKKERDELAQYQKKQLKKWVEDNLSGSLQKKAKMLVIDQSFCFYEDHPRTDKYPYTIRCIPFFDDVSEELERLQPQVIAFSLDAEDAANPRNTNEAMVKLFDVIKAKFSDLDPFIVIFNSPIDSKEMQDNVGYPHVMSTSNEISVDILIKMAEMFEKKMVRSGRGETKGANQVYLKKTHSSSLCEILLGINVIKLSETDMVFQTDVDIPIGANLHLTEPVDMYINVQPMKSQGKVPEFHGLIHCLGEEEKKELRKYVNSIFFREHDAKLMAESEEFKKLNDTKLNEKIEAQKKIEDQANEDQANKDQVNKDQADESDQAAAQSEEIEDASAAKIEEAES